jgi:putative endonuclease
MSQQLGFVAEERARLYLIDHGLVWMASNYRCKCGEIDLIMRDKTHLVFIEVRSRTSDRFGGAAASITRKKREKIIKSALIYLMVHKLQDKMPVRFDVLIFEGCSPQVEWIKNAFEVE